MQIKAKRTSLFAQITAALWVAGWATLKFLSNRADIQIKDICLSGIFIAACFSPVYFSIILDKIKDIKVGSDNINI
jgi:hypothetical protein